MMGQYERPDGTRSCTPAVPGAMADNEDGPCVGQRLPRFFCVRVRSSIALSTTRIVLAVVPLHVSDARTRQRPHRAGVVPLGANYPHLEPTPSRPRSMPDMPLFNSPEGETSTTKPKPKGEQLAPFLDPRPRWRTRSRDESRSPVL